MNSYVYVVEFDGATKIGYSNYPERRMVELASQVGKKHINLFIVACDNAIDVEFRVKYLLNHLIIPFHGITTECFSCTFGYLKDLVEELTSCEALPNLISKKMEEEGVPLPLFIAQHHNGSASALGRTLGVMPNQVNRWLKRNCVVIDGVVYCEVSKQVNKKANKEKSDE